MMTVTFARRAAMLATLVAVALTSPVVAAQPSPSATAAPSSDPSSTSAPADAPPEAESEAEEEKSALAQFNGFMAKALFFDVTGGAVQVPDVDFDGNPVMEDGKQKIRTIEFPFLVLVLVLGAIFFTLYYRFINVRGLRHAIDVVRGKYDNPDDEGEISHFHALTSALSATVGLGNIAGVAVAIVRGGPGAVVWMMIVAVFASAAKFSSCTLAQLYRQVNPDGSISGGPMYYLDLGLKGINGPLGKLGKVLGVFYAFMVMGGAFGGGNMFQSNQTVEALCVSFGMTVKDATTGAKVPDQTAAYAIGIIMAIFVGAVILGGIKRIGAATSKIVPFMVAIYVIAAIFVIIVNIGDVPEAFALMFSMAFTKNAFYGGMMGVLVTGVQRAAFSNEGGIGSAAIAHAAAKTDEPVREGMVAMLGPYIDTILVCTMTALVVIVTGQWKDPSVIGAESLQGAAVTANAFATVIDWFPKVLSISIALFAYSTMVSWCYYGERGWIYLLDHFDGLGLKSVFVFRILFVLAVVVGAVNNLEDVLAFSDIMILSMAFPNIIGSVILAHRLRPKVEDYWRRYTSGEMKTYGES